MATREQVLKAAEYAQKAAAIDDILCSRHASIVLCVCNTFGRIRETPRLDFPLVAGIETTVETIIIKKALRELKAHYLQLAGVDE